MTLKYIENSIKLITKDDMNVAKNLLITFFENIQKNQQQSNFQKNCVNIHFLNLLLKQSPAFLKDNQIEIKLQKDITKYLLSINLDGQNGLALLQSISLIIPDLNRDIIELNHSKIMELLEKFIITFSYLIITESEKQIQEKLNIKKQQDSNNEQKKNLSVEEFFMLIQDIDRIILALKDKECSLKLKKENNFINIIVTGLLQKQLSHNTINFLQHISEIKYKKNLNYVPILVETKLLLVLSHIIYRRHPFMQTRFQKFLLIEKKQNPQFNIQLQHIQSNNFALSQNINNENQQILLQSNHSNSKEDCIDIQQIVNEYEKEIKVALVDSLISSDKVVALAIETVYSFKFTQYNEYLGHFIFNAIEYYLEEVEEEPEEEYQTLEQSYNQLQKHQNFQNSQAFKSTADQSKMISLINSSSEAVVSNSMMTNLTASMTLLKQKKRLKQKKKKNNYLMKHCYYQYDTDKHASSPKTPREAAAHAAILLDGTFRRSITMSLISGFVEKLMSIVLSDRDQHIRQILLTTLNENFVQYLNQQSYLQTLFQCISDVDSKVQQSSIIILCRLAHRNPQQIIPFLMKTVFHILSSLNQDGIYRFSVEDSQEEKNKIHKVQLLACLVQFGKDIVQSQIPSILNFAFGQLNKIVQPQQQSANWYEQHSHQTSQQQQQLQQQQMQSSQFQKTMKENAQISINGSSSSQQAQLPQQNEMLNYGQQNNSEQHPLIKQQQQKSQQQAEYLFMLLDLFVQISSVADVARKNECIRSALPVVAKLMMTHNIQERIRQRALITFSHIVRATGYCVLPYYENPSLPDTVLRFMQSKTIVSLDEKCNYNDNITQSGHKNHNSQLHENSLQQQKQKSNYQYLQQSGGPTITDFKLECLRLLGYVGAISPNDAKKFVTKLAKLQELSPVDFFRQKELLLQKLFCKHQFRFLLSLSENVYYSNNFEQSQFHQQQQQQQLGGVTSSSIINNNENAIYFNSSNNYNNALISNETGVGHHPQQRHTEQIVIGGIGEMEPQQQQQQQQNEQQQQYQQQSQQEQMSETLRNVYEEILLMNDQKQQRKLLLISKQMQKQNNNTYCNFNQSHRMNPLFGLEDGKYSIDNGIHFLFGNNNYSNSISNYGVQYQQQNPLTHQQMQNWQQYQQQIQFQQLQSQQGRSIFGSKSITSGIAGEFNNYNMNSLSNQKQLNMLSQYNNNQQSLQTPLTLPYTDYNALPTRNMILFAEQYSSKYFTSLPTKIALVSGDNIGKMSNLFMKTAIDINDKDYVSTVVLKQLLQIVGNLQYPKQLRQLTLEALKDIVKTLSTETLAKFTDFLLPEILRLLEIYINIPPQHHLPQQQQSNLQQQQYNYIINNNNAEHNISNFNGNNSDNLTNNTKMGQNYDSNNNEISILNINSSNPNNANINNDNNIITNNPISANNNGIGVCNIKKKWIVSDMLELVKVTLDQCGAQLPKQHIDVVLDIFALFSRTQNMSSSPYKISSCIHLQCVEILLILIKYSQDNLRYKIEHIVLLVHALASSVGSSKLSSQQSSQQLQSSSQQQQMFQNSYQQSQQQQQTASTTFNNSFLSKNITCNSDNKNAIQSNIVINGNNKNTELLLRIVEVYKLLVSKLDCYTHLIVPFFYELTATHSRSLPEVVIMEIINFFILLSSECTTTVQHLSQIVEILAKLLEEQQSFLVRENIMNCFVVLILQHRNQFLKYLPRVNQLVSQNQIFHNNYKFCVQTFINFGNLCQIQNQVEKDKLQTMLNPVEKLLPYKVKKVQDNQQQQQQLQQQPVSYNGTAANQNTVSGTYNYNNNFSNFSYFPQNQTNYNNNSNSGDYYNGSSFIQPQQNQQSLYEQGQISNNNQPKKSVVFPKIQQHIKQAINNLLIQINQFSDSNIYNYTNSSQQQQQNTRFQQQQQQQQNGRISQSTSFNQQQQQQYNSNSSNNSRQSEMSNQTRKSSIITQSKNFWLNWFQETSMQLIQYSPNSVLQQTTKVAQSCPELAKINFNMAFLALWNELSDQQRQTVRESLQKLIQVFISNHQQQSQQQHQQQQYQQQQLLQQQQQQENQQLQSQQQQQTTTIRNSSTNNYNYINSNNGSIYMGFDVPGQSSASSDALSFSALQMILDLSEYMEHSLVGLQIDCQLMGDLAQQCKAVAQELYYRENELEQYPTENTYKRLEQLYKDIDQPEMVAVLQQRIKSELFYLNQEQQQQQQLQLQQQQQSNLIPLRIEINAKQDKIDVDKEEQLSNWQIVIKQIQSELTESQKENQNLLNNSNSVIIEQSWMDIIENSKKEYPHFSQLMEKAAAAQMYLGSWDELGKTVKYLNDDHPEKDFWNAAVYISKNELEAARRSIRRAFQQQAIQCGSAEFTSVADSNSSSGRKGGSLYSTSNAQVSPANSSSNSSSSTMYKNLINSIGDSYFSYDISIRLQQLCEMEEIVDIRTISNKLNKLKKENEEEMKIECEFHERELRQKENQLLDTWQERLNGVSQDVEVWEKILSVRSLLYNKWVDFRMLSWWFKFCRRTLKNNQYNICYRIIDKLTKLNHNLENVQEQIYREQLNLLKLEYDYLVSIDKNQENNDKFFKENQSPQIQLNNNQENLCQIQSSNNQSNQPTQLIQPIQQFDQCVQCITTILQKQQEGEDKQHYIPNKLRAHYYIKLGNWHLERLSSEHNLTPEVYNNLNIYFSNATKDDPENYKSWHYYGKLNLMMSKVALRSIVGQQQQSLQQQSSQAGQQQQQLQQQMHQQVLQYVRKALEGFIKTIQHGCSARRRSKFLLIDMLRLLTVIFDYGWDAEVERQFRESLHSISVHIWVEVVPQIIGRIDSPHQSIQQLLQLLLTHIGRLHPQALIYNLTVASKSKQLVRRMQAIKIIDEIKVHSSTLISQALIISQGLNRAASLLPETWSNHIIKAYNHYSRYIDRRSKKMQSNNTKRQQQQQFQQLQQQQLLQQQQPQQINLNTAQTLDQIQSSVGGTVLLATQVQQQYLQQQQQQQQQLQVPQQQQQQISPQQLQQQQQGVAGQVGLIQNPSSSNNPQQQQLQFQQQQQQQQQQQLQQQQQMEDEEEAETREFMQLLQDLHAMMHAKPKSLSDIQFHQEYGARLMEAEAWLQRYQRSRDHGALDQAMDVYRHLGRTLDRDIKLIKSIDLQSVSPKLLTIKNCEVAIPGSYKPSQGHRVVKIAYFYPQLQVLESLQRPRKVLICGSDGKDYTFLLKGREDIRTDERVMQLFRLINQLLANNAKTKKKDLKLTRYSVVPLDMDMGLISWVQNCTTLKDLIVAHRQAHGVYSANNQKKLQQNAGGMQYNNRNPEWNVEDNLRDNLCSIIGSSNNNQAYDDENSNQQSQQDQQSQLNQLITYIKLPLINKVGIFREVLEQTRCEDLRRVLWLKSSHAQAWLDMRRNYTHSLATMSIVGYILGLGDRHLNNIMLHLSSGKIVHVDFGDCFEVTMTRNEWREKVPFRLTRMLVNALPAGTYEGTFRHICHLVMNISRDKSESLLAVLEAFVYDPLFIHTIEKMDFKHSQVQGQKLQQQLQQQQQQQQQTKQMMTTMQLVTDGASVNTTTSAQQQLQQLDQLQLNQQQQIQSNLPTQQQQDQASIQQPQSQQQQLQTQQQTTLLPFKSDGGGQGIAIAGVQQQQPLQDTEVGKQYQMGQNWLLGQNNNYNQVQNLSEKALRALKRIESKLTGLDFKTKKSDDNNKDEQKPISVEDQVNKLIKQATNIENLCQLYGGWSPLW